eukprot:487309_1
MISTFKVIWLRKSLIVTLSLFYWINICKALESTKSIINSVICNEINQCRNNVYHCVDNEPCRIICSADYACYNITLDCPANAECFVQCDGNQVCYGAHIMGQTTNLLSINGTGSAALASAIIKCPPSNCNIHITGNYEYQMLNTEFYVFEDKWSIYCDSNL